MKIVMMKLNNFQEVIAKIDEEKLTVEDFLTLNFNNVELSEAMVISGMSEKQHEGQKYALPEFQPLNVFGEKFEDPITMNVQGILYTHMGNPGLTEYYEYIVAQMTGGIVKTPEKKIVMPR